MKRALAHTLAAVSLAAACADAANYYVNDSVTNGDVYCTAAGSDLNLGVAPGSPKATVRNVLDAYDLGPGDTIWVDTGTYTPTNPADPDSTIRFLAQDSGSDGAYVTLQGSTNYAAGGSVLHRGTTAYDTLTCFSANYVAVRSARLTGGSYGLYVWQASNLLFDACDVTGNGGGGVHLRNCKNIKLSHTRVHYNSGRGFHIWEGDYLVYLDHCSVWDNYPTASGPGIWAEIWYGRDASSSYSLLSISNSIVVARTNYHHVIHSDATTMKPYVGNYNDLVALDGAYFIGSDGPYYSSLSSWQAATTQDLNSISLDPLFTADGHLKSRAGTWSNGAWVVHTTNSPCIDRGNPASPFSNEPAPNGGRVNIGAFGNTAQASQTADVDGDGLSDNSECYEYGTNPNSADSDDDAYNDFSELIAGTGANNGTNFFSFASGTQTNGKTFRMTWYGVTNRTYQPQWRTNLLSGAWSNCTGLVNPSGQVLATLVGSNAWITAIDTNANGRATKLYRIKVKKP